MNAVVEARRGGGGVAISFAGVQKTKRYHKPVL